MNLRYVSNYNIFYLIITILFRDNKPLDDKLADKVKVTSKGNTFTLTVQSCTPAESGQYTCRVTAQGGESATCSANLEVHNCKYCYEASLT